MNRFVIDNLHQAYEEGPAEEHLADYLSRHADPKLLGRIISWMNTDLGRDIESAEKASSSPAGAQEFTAFAEQFRDAPPTDMRRKLINDLQKASGLEESLTDLYGNSIRNTILLYQQALQEEKKIPEDSLSAYVEKIQKENAGLIRGRVFLSLLFTYRSLSNADLMSYIDWQNSRDGREFNRLSQDGILYVFNRIYRNAGKLIEAKLAEGWRPPRPSRPVEKDQPNDSAEEVAELLAKAHDHVQEGRFEEAVALYNEALNNLPVRTETFLLLADCYRTMQYRYEEIATLRRALSHDPQSIPARAALVDAYLAVGSVAAAKLQNTFLHQLDPDEARNFAAKISAGKEERRTEAQSSTTSRDFHSAEYMWLHGKVLRPYSRQIKGYPEAGQIKVLRFLDGYTHYATKHPPLPPLEDLILQGETILASGDPHPLVQFCYGLLLPENNKPSQAEEAEAALRAALNAFYLERDSYPEFLSFLAASNLGRIIHGRYRTAGKESTFWRNYALQTFRRSLLAGEFSGQEQHLAMNYLIRLPSLLFEPEDDKWIVIARELTDLPATSDWLQLVVQGKAEIDRAWQARGAGYARTVTEEAWSRFKEHLEKANDLLEQAWQLHPEYPAAASFLLTVARTGHNEPDHTSRFWLNQAIKAQADYLDAYYAYLYDIMPRWGGSHREMYDFGEECLLGGRFDTHVPFIYFEVLSRIAREMPINAYALPFRNPAVHRKLTELFDNMEKDGHTSELERKRIPLYRAVAAALYGDYDKARRLIDEINPADRSDKPFRDSSFYWKHSDLTSFATELAVFTGPAKEMVREAEALELQGDAEKARSLYLAALDRIDPTEAEARRYLLERIVWMQLDDVTLEDISRNEGQTALHYTSRKGRTDLVHFLLDHGFPAHCRTEAGYTPLHLAVAFRHPDVVHLLLAEGAAINARSDGFEMTPLHTAINEAKDPELALELIRAGADVNAVAYNGWTPLHLAAQRGYDDVCLALLEKGADLHAQLDNGLTVFDLMRHRKNTTVKDILMGFGSEEIPEEKITARSRMSRSHLESLYEQDPRDIETMFHLACKYKIEKKYDKALRFYQAILANGINRFTEKCCYYMGGIYTDLGDYPRAIELFRKQLELSPRSFVTYRHLARAYRLAGQKERAAEAEQMEARYTPPRLGKHAGKP